MQVKLERKKILADYIKKTLHIDVDIHSIFDVQAKRLHAYKRQLLNVMNIIAEYQHMKADPSYRIYPRTFIFAAKAAPAYLFAKQVIKLINCMADVINNDPEISPYMKVVFIPNYGVSKAEVIIPASDVSEQISTAGKEASGTSNMKFMINGAVTLGTLDGANVEIHQLVGESNDVIFGRHADELAQIRYDNSYNPWDIYNTDPRIKTVLDSLVDRSFSNDPERFRMIFDEIMYHGDEYFILLDFAAYLQASKKIDELYQDRRNWARICLVNVAKAGFFSSDRTIGEYNEEIWKLSKIKG